MSVWLCEGNVKIEEEEKEVIRTLEILNRYEYI